MSLYKLLGLDNSAQMFFYIMISFSFVIGIILTVAPEAFEKLNQALQKEYGIKKRILPKLEDTKFDVIDKILIRKRAVAGVIISVLSFILLLIYK